MTENSVEDKNDRVLSQRPPTVLYAAIITSAAAVFGIGLIFINDLSEKTYIFGPAFLIIMLVLFYQLVVQPKSFHPVRIQRYAMRPRAVDELALILASPNAASATKRLYIIFKEILCYKLEIPLSSDDTLILERMEKVLPSYLGDVKTALARYTKIAADTVKIGGEKEFIENYNFLLGILYAFDGKISAYEVKIGR